MPSEVIVRAPSAELSLNQKDENSLPPYKTLDGILKQYVDQGLAVEQIKTNGYDIATINRVVYLYNSSAFKRKQLAPLL